MLYALCFRKDEALPSPSRRLYEPEATSFAFELSPLTFFPLPPSPLSFFSFCSLLYLMNMLSFMTNRKVLTSRFFKLMLYLTVS